MDKKIILDDMWDFLIEVVNVSRETLQVATCLDGYSITTMQNVLYILTGYHSFTCYIEDEIQIPFPEVYSFYSLGY